MARLALIVCAINVVVPGCAWRENGGFRAASVPPAPANNNPPRTELSIEYPDVEAPIASGVQGLPAPLSVLTGEPRYRDMKLDEAVQTALMNNQVMRDLGGLVLRSPDSLRTVYGPAITETDPRFGVDAALSAFDASFASTAFFEKNDRALNNEFFGGGTRLLRQDAMVFQQQMSKRTATGTEFSLRHNTDYDANNAPANLFPSAWNTNFEAIARQPLLQGAGLDYNRIVGPGGQPGLNTGVLVARTNTDASLAEFETAVINLVSDVENAYWDLYFAYRDLDSKIIARNAALETWRRIHALFQSGRRGGEAENEAHAREQYFRFEEEVQNALAGQPVEGTHTYNGSSGGTFRATGGVLVCERRLRLLLGMPITDEFLLRPADEPKLANVVFNWDELLAEAVARRPELRRQRWLVKRREMELVASRNFLLPRLDASGRYRWRGFGKDLIGPSGGPLSPFDNAWENLVTGDFQEWQLGMEFSMPLGFRRAHAAVQNAEWMLARERAVLREQERQVAHDISTAVAEKDRSYAVVQTSFNRRLAAHQQLGSVQAAYDADKALLDFVLQAQQLAADAENRYHRALVEYALSIKNVHYEKGSLLEYNNIGLAESAWSAKAYRDAAENNQLRARVGPLNYILRRQPPVTMPVAPGPPPMMPPNVVEPTNSDASSAPIPLPPPASPVSGPSL